MFEGDFLFSRDGNVLMNAFATSGEIETILSKLFHIGNSWSTLTEIVE